MEFHRRSISRNPNQSSSSIVQKSLLIPQLKSKRKRPSFLPLLELTPTKTSELKSRVEKIARVSRSCKDYASKEKVDILYGLNAALAAPIAPLPLIDEPLIPMHQPHMAIKVEAEEANVAQPLGNMDESTKEMGEKIKALEAQLSFARQSGADDDELKKSQEFQQSILQYIHNNLEAFLAWELANPNPNPNPNPAASSIEKNKKVQNKKEGYYACKWSMQKSIYDRLMLEFDAMHQPTKHNWTYKN